MATLRIPQARLPQTRQGLRWHILIDQQGAVLAVWAVLLLTTAGASIISPTFRSWANLSNVLSEAVILGLVSLGQTFVIVTGGIDLSVGAIVKLVTVLTAGMMEKYTGAWIGVVMLVVAAGGLVGLVNGLLVIRLRVAPFIVTLGMASILGGAVLAYTQQPIGSITDQFYQLYNGQIGPVPLPIVSFAAAILLSQTLLRHSSFGRHIYAVGGNEEVARRAGIKVARVRLAVFLLAGLLAALAGLMVASQEGIGDPTVGDNLTLDSITAVVLGGTSLFGGRGSVFGTVGGILLLSLINNVMNLLGVDVWYQGVIKGIIILMAVAIYKQRST